MKTDLLVIELEGKRLSLPTSEIAGIVEVERISFLPGRTGIVEGIISLRGEPVAVIDIRKVYAGKEAGPALNGDPRKVVIVGSDGRTLGLDVAGLSLSFIWEKGHGPAGEDREGAWESAPSGETENDERPAIEVDWVELFERTAGILSTEGKGVEHRTDR